MPTPPVVATDDEGSPFMLESTYADSSLDRLGRVLLSV